MKVILETERLLLRQMSLADAPFMLALLNTPGWLQHIGDRAVKTVAQAEQYLLNGILKSYQEQGFGFWLVELKESRQPVGIAGLIRREGMPDVDLGYALLPQFEGRGYALESASATLTYARQVLGLGRILAITSQQNEGSIRLLEKIGFRRQGSICLPGSSEELFLFEAAGEWSTPSATQQP
ncbi:GNAT family N-acetyltransferase [Cesiribacter andamanensis]|uniref:Ribosomal-protein-S5-alanine N-acetyltransferase n=1 Tax=Cesiribacter andamanensis AMV16 TaxID=1279009 RepID=M7N320_9BACT|nr:GNAT family N-acetyltransferase [Cesiribacter andamanensis]EMR03083.1 ribosomal-protein-S5-alanine N-acetyltransferase [Cesiribacter andamanensis AMV16]